MEFFITNTKQIAKRVAALMVVLLTSLQISAAQQQTVTGKVVDNSNNPIFGATVIVQGTTRGVTTDFDGKFSINVSPGEVLTFGFIGFSTAEETVSAARTYVEVLLNPDAVAMDEIIVTGYSTQSRITMTGSVASVKGEELETISAPNVTTALTGQMPGLTIQNDSGWAGSTSTTMSIRGVSTDGDNTPLVLVDGFERTIDDLDMSEIESISVLKDASSTAVYGVRGANGVLIVTTKQGQASEKIQFNLKAELGFNVLSDIPETLDSYQYALLYNEGLANDNIYATDDSWMIGLFTDEEIEHYRTGDSPILYPNNNLTDWVFNDFGISQKYTLTMNGGNDKVTYFNTVAYDYQSDALKDYGQGYDAGSWYDRVNLRSNVKAKLTSTTTLGFNMSAQFSTTNRPNLTMNQIIRYIMCMPTSASPGIIDGNVTELQTGFWGSTSPAFNVYEEVYDQGYTKARANKIQATATLDQDLSFLTEGLKGSVYFSYDNNNSTTFSWDHEPTKYYISSYDEETGEFTYVAPTSDAESTQSRSTARGAVYMRFRAMLNYNKSFGDGHNVSALAVYNIGDQGFSSSGDYTYVPYRMIEIASKVSYNYKERYLLDLNVGVSASENFHPSNRWGTFPAGSVGWIVSKESWFPKNNVLTFLKLKGSYGMTGNDGSDRFYYKGTYYADQSGSNVYSQRFGPELGGANSAYNYVGLAENPETTWEKNYQSNVGITTEWFRDRLTIEAEVYRNDRKDILMTPTTVSSALGITEVRALNMKEMRAQGYEVSLNWADNIGKFSYRIGGSVSYYENMIMEMGEVDPTYEWQRQTGNSISQYQGYAFEGFYTQKEIDILAATNFIGTQELPGGVDGVQIQAGDAKYRDMNGDGIISVDDMVWHDALTVPPYTYTLNAGFNYKNWGLTVLMQGTAGSYYEYQELIRIPYQAGRNNTSTAQLDRWTPETAETATLPRMTAYGAGTNHNYVDSDLWLANNRYLRVKNVELSYKFATESIRKFGLSSMRVYISGSNLYTFTPITSCDPETRSGIYSPIPPNKVFTAGVQVGF